MLLKVSASLILSIPSLKITKFVSMLTFRCFGIVIAIYLSSFYGLARRVADCAR